MAFSFVCAAELLRGSSSVRTGRYSSADKRVVRWFVASGWFFRCLERCPVFLRLQYFVRLFRRRKQAPRPTNAVAHHGRSRISLALALILGANVSGYESTTVLHGRPRAGFCASVCGLRSTTGSAACDSQLPGTALPRLLVSQHHASHVRRTPRHFIDGRTHGAVSAIADHGYEPASAGKPAVPAVIRYHWSDRTSWHETESHCNSLGR